MPCNLNPQRAQLLHQAPDLRAAGADLLGDLGAAHDNGGVVHQQADNPPQAEIGFWVRAACGAVVRERLLGIRLVLVS